MLFTVRSLWSYTIEVLTTIENKLCFREIKINSTLKAMCIEPIEKTVVDDDV